VNSSTLQLLCNTHFYRSKVKARDVKMQSLLKKLTAENC